MIAEEILDKAQERLHDNGVLWTRAELLEWLNDGYRQIMSRSHVCVRPYQYDMPPRTTFSGTHEWEDSLLKGTFQKFTHSIREYECTYEWEVEQLEGVSSPSNSYPAVSQLWELAYTDDTNRHFRFVVGKQHDRPLRLYWDDKQLVGTSDREMDLRDTRWWRESGEPIAWLKGDGRDQSFEVFETSTTYCQSYFLQDSQAGIPRQFSGSRTYTTVNPEYQSKPYGIARRVYSDDRQYLAAPYDGSTLLPVGSPRDYKSSLLSVTLWETIVPTRLLTEQDEPVLIPGPIHKYLKFYVLGRAFSRKGEGQKLDLAEHYMALFDTGVTVLANLGDLSFIDKNYAREEADPIGKGRPPRPRLPSTYPSISWS